MKILFVTFDIPFPVRYGGQVYTGNIIRELAAREDVELTVACFGKLDDAFKYGARWITHTPPKVGILKQIFTRLPVIARRYKSSDFERSVLKEATSGAYDLIVLDYVVMGWLLRPLRRALQGLKLRPAISYMSHNVETLLRRQIADNMTGGFIKRVAAKYDAWRAYRLEGELLKGCDFSSAETDEDIRDFNRLFNVGSLVKLTPGYDGSYAQPRAIGPDQANNLVVLGGRLSIMKQLVLDKFLADAAAPLHGRGWNIHVVGPIDEGYKSKLIRLYPYVHFHGFVEDVSPIISKMSVGVIADHVGGGFKHRLLTHVFHRLPMVSVPEAMAGLPLSEDSDYISVRCYSEIPAALDKVGRDFSTLNAMQHSAFEKCRAAYSWSENVDSYLMAARRYLIA